MAPAWSLVSGLRTRPERTHTLGGGRRIPWGWMSASACTEASATGVPATMNSAMRTRLRRHFALPPLRSRRQPGVQREVSAVAARCRGGSFDCLTVRGDALFELTGELWYMDKRVTTPGGSLPDG